MIRTLRAAVALFGVLSGIGFLRAGLWFLHDARNVPAVAEESPSEGSSVILPSVLNSLAAMGLALAVVLLFLSSREMVRLWRTRA